MKFNKTWGTIGGFVVAAPLTGIAFMASIKLGIAVLVGLFILARVLRGPSESGGVIGVDHQNAPGQRPPRRNGGGIQTFFPPRGGH
jgi:hypothetical protein